MSQEQEQRPPKPPTVTIWHNQACSKSRATVEQFQKLGFAKLELVPYLVDAPNAEQIREVLGMLGIGARELIRTSEQTYEKLGLADPALSEEQLVAAMASHPILIQRPIAFCNGRAAIGRPPYRALAVLVPPGEAPPVHEVLKSKIKEEGI